MEISEDVEIPEKSPRFFCDAYLLSGGERRLLCGCMDGACGRLQSVSSTPGTNGNVEAHAPKGLAEVPGAILAIITVAAAYTFDAESEEREQKEDNQSDEWFRYGCHCD